MLKFVLLIVSLLLIQLSFSSPPCTTAEMTSIKKCQSKIVELRGMIKTAQIEDPTAETMKELNSECKKTIDCVGPSNCSLFVESVVKSCEAIDLVENVLLCYFNVAVTIKSSPEKYPCLKENGIDVNSKNSLCKLIKNGKPCFESVTKQICGKEVKVDRIEQLAEPYLKCA